MSASGLSTASALWGITRRRKQALAKGSISCAPNSPKSSDTLPTDHRESERTMCWMPLRRLGLPCGGTEVKQGAFARRSAMKRVWRRRSITSTNIIK
jgi:hypothetical protein